ncbi:MAG: heavy metal translocating P-type ATPase, partial [Thermoplasmatota archaeon]
MPEASSGGVQPPPRAARAIVRIGGMSCAVCAGAVEGALRSVEGVAEASVSLGAEKAVVVFKSGPVPHSRLRAAVEAAGYSYLGVEGEESERVEREARERELRAKLLRAAIGLAFGAPLMVLSLLPHELWHRVGLGMGDVSFVMLLVSIAPFAYTSGPIFSAAHRSLRARTLSMDVMYAMGIGVAYVSSAMGTFGVVLTSDFMFYDSALLLAAFLMFGRYLETRARGRTSEAIESLLRLQPKTAVVIVDGRRVERRVEDVGVGEAVLVRPGERVPVDGTVVEGESFVDESMMTGEPMPVHKAPGSPATGGTLNGSGALMIRAERVGSETALARIIRMVEEAQLSRPRIQRLADRAVAWFIPFVLAIALSSLALWYLVLGASLLFSLGTLISVLVIACPCALGLATPTAVTVGVGRGAELGILIRSSEAFETSKELTIVVFDKTGTLTRGRPEVTDVIPAPGVSEAELLRVASGVERGSTHPIAEAILRAAGERGVEPAGAEGFRAQGGRGASATLIPAGAPSSAASGEARAGGADGGADGCAAG